MGLPWWFSSKESACQWQESRIRSLDGGDPLEKEMATHSSILSWEIPWREEPGGLYSMGSQKSWTPPGDLTTTTFVEYILVVKMNVCGTLYFYYIYLWFLFSFSSVLFKVEQTVFYLNISYSNSILRKLKKCVLSYLLTHDALSYSSFSDAICCFCINSSFHAANWTLLVIVRLLLSGSFWFLEAKWDLHAF